MSFRVFIHKTCPTSVRLLEKLREASLKKDVEIIDVSQEPFKILNNGAVSVPLIEFNGELIDMGPINFDLVIQTIKEKRKIESKFEDFKEIAEKLLDLVTDNVFYAISVFLRNSLVFLLDSNIVKEYLGLVTVEEFRSWLKRNEDSLLRERMVDIERTIIRNFLFETKLVFGRRITLEDFKANYSLENIAHWLIARGSVARIGLVDTNNINIGEKAKVIYRGIEDKLSE